MVAVHVLFQVIFLLFSFRIAIVSKITQMLISCKNISSGPNGWGAITALVQGPESWGQIHVFNVIWITTAPSDHVHDNFSKRFHQNHLWLSGSWSDGSCAWRPPPPSQSPCNPHTEVMAVIVMIMMTIVMIIAIIMAMKIYSTFLLPILALIPTTVTIVTIWQYGNMAYAYAYGIWHMTIWQRWRLRLIGLSSGRGGTGRTQRGKACCRWKKLFFFSQNV